VWVPTTGSEITARNGREPRQKRGHLFLPVEKRCIGIDFGNLLPKLHNPMVGIIRRQKDNRYVRVPNGSASGVLCYHEWPESFIPWYKAEVMLRDHKTQSCVRQDNCRPVSRWLQTVEARKTRQLAQ
jgi:hypothetical protein